MVFYSSIHRFFTTVLIFFKIKTLLNSEYLIYGKKFLVDIPKTEG